MRRLIIRPAARLDLIEIGDYIAEDNPDRAMTFVAEIEQQMRKCAERPISFPAREDLGVGLRSARYGRYLIFFTDDGFEVQIVRVQHGMRDLRRVFGV